MVTGTHALLGHGPPGGHGGGKGSLKTGMKAKKIKGTYDRHSNRDVDYAYATRGPQDSVALFNDLAGEGTLHVAANPGAREGKVLKRSTNRRGRGGNSKEEAVPLPTNAAVVAGACAVMGTLIPAGAALAEEAAAVSQGDGAISALFGAAVVFLTVVTGSVGYLSYLQWQDNRTEIEDRKRYDQANRDREYDDAMAAFATPGGTPKKKKQRRDKNAGFG